MYRVRQEDLPFKGSSHEFVGADNGEVNVSVFLLSALPGRGPGPHRHPYDEVQFVREGRGLWTVDGKEFEAGAGDILVASAPRSRKWGLLHERLVSSSRFPATGPDRSPGEVDPVVGPRPHVQHGGEPAGLVHLAPARVGCADPGC